MKKLSILVIDDNPTNLASAIEQFSDSEKYKLITTSNYEGARKLLDSTIWDNDKKERYPNPERFDAVLTDLFLPGIDHNGEAGAGPEQPLGLVFALRAISLGVKMVAIVTSGTHHQDPFIYSFDMIGGLLTVCGHPIQIQQTKFCCSGYWDSKGKPKNWKEVLDTLSSMS